MRVKGEYDKSLTGAGQISHPHRLRAIASVGATTMPPAAPCKAITPQIAWHGKEPVLSIDVSVTGFVATGGADNEVVLWRLRLNKEPGEAVCWVQTLTIHTKVGWRGLQPT